MENTGNIKYMIQGCQLKSADKRNFVWALWCGVSNTLVYSCLPFWGFTAKVSTPHLPPCSQPEHISICATVDFSWVCSIVI